MKLICKQCKRDFENKNKRKYCCSCGKQRRTASNMRSRKKRNLKKRPSSLGYLRGDINLNKSKELRKIFDDKGKHIGWLDKR